MRFYQSWNEPWQSAAQRAQQCVTAYRSRQQPSAEEATAIMSPFFYSVNNGRHASVNYDRRSINILYMRTNDVFVGDYTADTREFVVHVAVCASSRKAREVAQMYDNTYIGWDLVGTLVDYNPGNTYNRIYRRAIASTRNEFAVSSHFSNIFKHFSLLVFTGKRISNETITSSPLFFATPKLIVVSEISSLTSK